jgi:predicted cupin superfamily sugar epimerase
MQANTSEGGWFAPVYTSSLSVPAYATPSPKPLPICSSIYYLITKDSFSVLHRVTSDMLYHFYSGDPVDVLMLDPSNGKGAHHSYELGNGRATKQRPTLVVPAGTWMGSRVKDGGSYALMGVSMAPGFDPVNYEIGRADVLKLQFPKLSKQIARYTR